MTAVLQRLFNVRRDEVAPVLLSALFFFCVLTALMVLRPAREALGMQRGIEALRWLFIGTAVVTLLVNPVFGLLVSRFRRLQFHHRHLRLLCLSLLGFYLVMVFAPEAIGVTSGQVFYVWFSVFNLFITMLFWALMADRFSLEQGKRFFPLIAVGGTLGAIFGPWLASMLAQPLGTPALLLSPSAFSCWPSRRPGRWRCCSRSAPRRSIRTTRRRRRW
jgi:ATP:ADP antiporter, AAA family